MEKKEKLVLEDDYWNRDGYKIKDITRPRYRVGDLATIFNVSTETIRYYERIGIIESYRSESNIRYFDSTSIFTLFMLRYKQLYGFSNTEIAEHQNNASLKEVHDQLNEKKEALVHEMNLLKMKIEKMDEAKKEMEMLLYHLNEPRLVTTNEMIMWEFWREYDFVETDYAKYGFLDEYFPLTNMGFITTNWYPDKIRFTPKDRNYGLLVESKWLDMINISKSAETKVIPASTCLEVYLSDEGGYMVDKLSRLIESIKNEYVFTGPPWGFIDFVEYVNKKRTYYFKVYIPVKK